MWEFLLYFTFHFTTQQSLMVERAMASAPETRIEYQVEHIEHLPKSVYEKVFGTLYSKQGGFQAIPYGNKIYLILALGEQPTSGYSIELTRISKKGNFVFVEAKKSDPPSNSFVNPVITYPHLIISIQSMPNVQFQYKLIKKSTG
jgi:hypothetical protein